MDAFNVVLCAFPLLTRTGPTPPQPMDGRGFHPSPATGIRSKPECGIWQVDGCGNGDAKGTQNSSAVQVRLETNTTPTAYSLMEADDTPSSTGNEVIPTIPRRLIYVYTGSYNSNDVQSPIDFHNPTLKGSHAEFIRQISSRVYLNTLINHSLELCFTLQKFAPDKCRVCPRG